MEESRHCLGIGYRRHPDYIKGRFEPSLRQIGEELEIRLKLIGNRLVTVSVSNARNFCARYAVWYNDRTILSSC
jgi:hypothetical protein